MTTSDALDLTGPHWAFALDVYGRPGVSEACLRLQDECGVDVNVLLLALYGVARGAPVSAGWVAEADAAVARLRDEVIVPLRAIRRRMKAMPEAELGRSFEDLRGRVKSAELHAEQLEQAVLARLVRGDGAGRGDFAETAAVVATFYGERRGMPATGERIREAVAAVAAAAHQAAA